MKKVTVIGSGSWGTALAVMLAENGHEVFIWSRRQDAVDELLKERTNKKYLPGVVIPDAIQATTDRKEAVDGADIVILAVPSNRARFCTLSENMADSGECGKGPGAGNTVPAFGCHQKRSAPV